MLNDLDNLIEKFGLPENPRTDHISKDLVMNWMQSREIEVLGALYAFVSKRDYAMRIVPHLAFADYFAFFLSYFRRCLIENPGGEWTHSRYEAAWEFASWFCALWNEGGVDRKTFDTLRSFLANIYLGGDSSVRDCIVDGALEHMFENREISKYFGCWKNDDNLSAAYNKAILWRAKGGESKLNRVGSD